MAVKANLQKLNPNPDDKDRFWIDVGKEDLIEGDIVRLAGQDDLVATDGETGQSVWVVISAKNGKVILD